MGYFQADDTRETEITKAVQNQKWRNRRVKNKFQLNPKFPKEYDRLLTIQYYPKMNDQFNESIGMRFLLLD